MTLGGGLIGCGFFARNHIQGWRELEGAEIAAVCDSDLNRVTAFAREFGVATTYTNAEEMLQKERLDFVDVVTQPGSHRTLVELAAAHRVPVICQKPLALTLEDGQAMQDACQKANIPFMVHENFRWQTSMRVLKKEAESLGSLFFGRLTFRTPYDVYANQPYLAEEPRFIIADLGVHVLDLARFFFGEVERLTCQTHRVNPRIKGEDAATILLQMRSGAACVVDFSYASKYEEDLFPQTLVQLEGADGTASLGPHYDLTAFAHSKAVHRTVASRKYAWTQAPFEAVQQSVVAIQQHWLDCLQTGAEPETSGADNLKTLELVFGAYDSAEQQQPYIVRHTP